MLSRTTLAIAQMLLFLFSAAFMEAEPEISFKNTVRRGVSVIGPESPTFSRQALALVSGTQQADATPILPFSYLVKNESPKTIVAYSSRWRLTDKNGKTTTNDCTWWNFSTMNDGEVILPHNTRLISPVFRLTSIQNAAGGGIGAEVERVVKQFSSMQKVEGSLETVIFSDGSALGADSTNAIDQARAYVDAERIVFGEYISKTKGQLSKDEMTTWLKTFIGGSNRSSGIRTIGVQMSNPPKYEESLALYRKSAAEKLLLQLNQGVSPDVARMTQSLEAKKTLTFVQVE